MTSRIRAGYQNFPLRTNTAVPSLKFQCLRSVKIDLEGQTYANFPGLSTETVSYVIEYK
jgi:hypothetical protein